MAEETTLLEPGIPDSPVHHSYSDDGGYSTDYSTLEVVRRPNREGPAGKGHPKTTFVEEELDSNGEREEVAVGAIAEVELEENIRLLPRPGNTEEYKEDGMRDDSDSIPYNINCSLIPWCAVHHWCFCRAFCCIWMGLLVIGIAVSVAVGLFWTIEIFKQRPNISKTMDLATSGIYNLTSVFPSSNVYGTEICLSFEHSTSQTIQVGYLAYVTLISENCRDVTAITYRNESLFTNSALQYNSYMFHWHKGSFFHLYAKVNGSSTTTIYLLNDRVSDMYCSKHLKPNFIVKQWSLNLTHCNLNWEAGYFDCFLDYAIETTDTYYLCINTTIYTQLSYNMTISSVFYNTSSSKLSLDCTHKDSCCLPFNYLLSEAMHPTCMYVSTQPLDPSYIGMELVNVNLLVSQRLSVVFYSLILLVALLLILLVTFLYYLTVLYKVNHSDFNPLGCTIYCSLYGVKK